MTTTDPFASLKAANKERAVALAAEPDDEPEEELMATFKAVLPPLTVRDRWELARFLEETAQRTVAHPDSNRAADWERALIAVLGDLATAVRDAKGRKIASAQEAHDVASPVTLSVNVSLNRPGRETLHRVFKAARFRAPNGDAGAAARAIADQFETFVYGPGGEQPAEPRRRRDDERPGLWEPVGTATSFLGMFRR